jgi:hypothetical protein
MILLPPESTGSILRPLPLVQKLSQTDCDDPQVETPGEIRARLLGAALAAKGIGGGG